MKVINTNEEFVMNRIKDIIQELCKNKIGLNKHSIMEKLWLNSPKITVEFYRDPVFPKGDKNV